jgi:hypothetical protein
MSHTGVSASLRPVHGADRHGPPLRVRACHEPLRHLVRRLSHSMVSAPVICAQTGAVRPGRVGCVGLVLCVQAHTEGVQDMYAVAWPTCHLAHSPVLYFSGPRAVAAAAAAALRRLLGVSAPGGAAHAPGPQRGPHPRARLRRLAAELSRRGDGARARQTD